MTDPTPNPNPLHPLHVHGDYKRVTHEQVMKDAVERDYTIVSKDTIVARMGGAYIVHIVAGPVFWTLDEPDGYSVELIRPRWMYGNEGILTRLEFIGRLEEDWLDCYYRGLFRGPNAEDENDPFPECCDFVWALPNATAGSNGKPWKLVEKVSWMDAIAEDARS